MIKNIFLTILASVFFISCEELLIGPDPENNPKNNFEILWKGFEENYSLFPVKNVNWDSLHIVYGSRISASTTQSELWDICGAMISLLNDGHVVLFNKGTSKAYQSSEISQRSMILVLNL